MYKLYIFDIGGVLCDNSDVIPAIVSHLGITENYFFTHFGDNFRKLLEGKTSSHQFWEDFTLRTDKVIKEELFGKFFHPKINEEVHKYILRLRVHSRVVCGTNVIDSHYQYLLKRKVYDIFDKSYCSHIMGIAKPNPDFYRYILYEEGVKPEEAVFVDDMEENVAAAQKIGLKSIIFQGLDFLIKRIED